MKTGILCIFLVLSTVTAAAQDAAKSKSIEAKIVTWNIQMLPNSLALFSKALRKKQAVRAPWIVEHCKQQNYDVIVFEEVFDLNIKRQLKKDLKAAYPYQVNTKTKCGRLTSNGIFIVSRIPMKYVDHLIYKKGAHEDGWAAKGCTLVEVEKEGIRFQIAGTHLQSGRSKAAVKHRDLQCQDIRKLLDSNVVEGIPVFVMGDMNIRKSNKEKYSKMLEVIGVKDFPLNEKEPYTIDGKNSWNKHEKGIQLDYIMLQKRQTSTQITKQKILRPKRNYKGQPMDLADHYGVVAEVKIFNLP